MVGVQATLRQFQPLTTVQCADISEDSSRWFRWLPATILYHLLASRSCFISSWWNETDLQGEVLLQPNLYDVDPHKCCLAYTLRPWTSSPLGNKPHLLWSVLFGQPGTTQFACKTFYIKWNNSAIILYAAADPPSLHVCDSHFDEYGPLIHHSINRCVVQLLY